MEADKASMPVHTFDFLLCVIVFPACVFFRYVVTLSRSLVEPFITFSDRRDLRERAWKAWTSRGELDPARDNLAVAKEILQLRAEQVRPCVFIRQSCFVNVGWVRCQLTCLLRGESDWRCCRWSLRLSKPQAALHGFASFAAYQASDSMAQTPARIMSLLEEVWGKAKVSADTERRALEEYMRASAPDAPGIEAWDWRYYAEKVMH
jgi:peptidyl-dipeptidase Dcp